MEWGSCFCSFLVVVVVAVLALVLVRVLLVVIVALLVVVVAAVDGRGLLRFPPTSCIIPAGEL